MLIAYKKAGWNACVGGLRSGSKRLEVDLFAGVSVGCVLLGATPGEGRKQHCNAATKEASAPPWGALS